MNRDEMKILEANLVMLGGTNKSGTGTWTLPVRHGGSFVVHVMGPFTDSQRKPGTYLVRIEYRPEPVLNRNYANFNITALQKAIETIADLSAGETK